MEEDKRPGQSGSDFLNIREAVERSLRRQVSRRRFGGLAAAYLAGAVGIDAVLAACGASNPSSNTGGNTPSNKKGGIQVVNFFTTENDPGTMAAANAAINAFEAKYPNAHISMIIISGDERDQRARTGLSVGQDLGVFEIDRAYSAEFVQAGYLEPLDDLINSIGADQFAVGTRQIIDGHDHVFPYGMGPFCLWYRTDRVSSAPTSVDELIAAAKSNTGGGRYGFTAAVGDFGAVENTLPQFIWAHGGDYFDREGNVVYGSSNVEAAISAVAELLKYSPPGNTNWSPFQFITNYISGLVAMSPWAGRLGLNVAEQKPSLIPTTNVEVGPWGPIHAGLTRVSTVAVDKHTAYPNLAKEWIKFYLTGKYGVAYANSVPGQLVPAIKSVRDASIAATDNTFISAHRDWVKTLSDQAPFGTDPGGPMGAFAGGKAGLYNGAPAPWSLTAFGANSIDSQMLQKIALQHYSVKDAHKFATDAYKTLVKSYKQQHPNWKKLITG